MDRLVPRQHVAPGPSPRQVALCKVARVGGARLVHTYHGHVLADYFDPLRTAWLRRLERSLAARTDLLLAISPSCADELAQLGVASRERISTCSSSSTSLGSSRSTKSLEKPPH